MALAHARRAEQQHVGTAFQPLMSFGQRRYLRLGHAGHRRELEVRQPLVRAQARFGAVAGDAPRRALGHLVLEQGFEQSVSGPTFVVGLRTQVSDQTLDRGQPQFGEHQPQTPSCGHRCAAHRTTSINSS